MEHIFLQAIIVGTKGTLKLKNFWTSIELIHADERSETFPLPSGAKHAYNFFNSANFAHEVELQFNNVTSFCLNIAYV